MERSQKTKITFPARSLDCVHYSQCLMRAVHQFLSTDSFSCARCKTYEQEEIADVEKVREGMRALKLLRAVWKDEKRSLQRTLAFSVPSP
jgi:hypothetical protein